MHTLAMQECWNVLRSLKKSNNKLVFAVDYGRNDVTHFIYDPIMPTCDSFYNAIWKYSNSSRILSLGQGSKLIIFMSQRKHWLEQMTQ